MARTAVQRSIYGYIAQFFLYIIIFVNRNMELYTQNEWQREYIGVRKDLHGKWEGATHNSMYQINEKLH